MEFEFRWGGENPKYAIFDRVTLELHHGGMFENGVYKGGKVCYLDNIVDDFLSLLDLRKIRKEWGYTVDVSKIEQTMEIRYRKAGQKDGNILELITSDAKVVEMVGCMPCNRVLVLYYTDLENSNDVDNDGKGVTWHTFSEPGDADADVEVGNEGENEAAATENGEVGNEGENEENDAEFVDSENIGPTIQPNAGENVEPTIDPNACENVGPTVQPHGHEKVGPTYEAPGEFQFSNSRCKRSVHFGSQTYQVTHMYGGEFVVDFRARTCSCWRWDLCWIPCGHAISAIFQRDESLIDYVDECYKPATYMKSYEPMIHPIPLMDQWTKSGHPPIHPPNVRVQPGRPKKARSKEPAEILVPPPPPPHPMPPNYVQPRDKLRRLFIKITCRRCGQSGHNRATCDRQNSENQQANASSAQKEVDTKGGAVRLRTYIGPFSLLQKSKKTTVNHRRVFDFSMVVESTVIFSLINHDAKSPSLLQYTTSSTNTKRRLCTAKDLKNSRG
ncbi:hypothetical protein PRUPE_3G123400 [Prunus persica]|uniref:SWIM-type domain-containing protein n=1 Tax=Prunus persica TaxID=3760 RepID=A0A251PZ14_PRUPE|nr:hypothetical protein PRUPE_3G123400 [Prunus persica]